MTETATYPTSIDTETATDSDVAEQLLDDDASIEQRYTTDLSLIRAVLVSDGGLTLYFPGATDTSPYIRPDPHDAESGIFDVVSLAHPPTHRDGETVHRTVVKRDTIGLCELLDLVETAHSVNVVPTDTTPFAYAGSRPTWNDDIDTTIGHDRYE